MGDQLAKGWADKKALEPGFHWVDEGSAIIVTRVPYGAPSLNPTEAEVQAEEDMLP